MAYSFRWWNKGCVWFSFWKMLLLSKSRTPTKQIEFFPEFVAFTEYNFHSTTFDLAFGFLFFQMGGNKEMLHKRLKWDIERCCFIDQTTYNFITAHSSQKLFHSPYLTIIFLQLTYEKNNKPKSLICFFQAWYRSLISYGVCPTRSTTLVHKLFLQAGVFY